jgi:hypothetical protein
MAGARGKCGCCSTATIDITLIIRMEVCCVGTTAAKMALDFGTGWRIMDGVEGNGVDMAAGRLFYSLYPSSSSSKFGISTQ